MTTSDWKKAYTQLMNKPIKLAKFNKHNMPKKRVFGKSIKKCRRCGNTRAYIQKYGINLCRKCFRETALNLGFKKYK